MDLVSLCRLPVASLLWQPRPGAWMLSFACKATFTLRPGEALLAQEHEPIHEADRHWGDDPAWSLYAPSDLVPIRPRVDVVVVGHAFAPGGKPARSLVARVAVADVDKAVEVFCDRVVGADGAVQEGAPFAKMPLLWERAAGGPETANPVGMRREERDRQGKRPLPNLQAPGARVGGVDEAIEPAGFGPIARAWPARRQKLGRHAASWSDEGWREQPLPQDIDASYFNAASRDQQASAIKDDARIVLENLSPEHARLITSLPGHHTRAFVQRPGKQPQTVAMRPDLLWIHTDRGICTLTWRGQIPVDHPREAGVVRIALEAPGEVLTWDDIGALPEADEAPASAGTRVLDVDEERSSFDGTMMGAPLPAAGGAILPFAKAPAAAPPVVPFAAPPQPAPPPPFAAASPAPPPVQPPAPPPAFVAAPPAAPPVPPPAPSSPFAAAPPPVPPPAPSAPFAAAPPPPSPSGESPWAARATGALGASNAAAAASAPWTLPRPEPAPSSAAVAVARPAPRPALEPREVVHLLWFDPESVPRLRRQPAWRKVLDALEQQPLDRDLDDPALAKTPMDVEDRRDAFEILTHAPATDAEGLAEAVQGAIREDGKFLPPLRLVAGELIFAFDELETLKATVTTVTPLLGADEQLRAAVEVAQGFLRMPDLCSAPAVSEGLTTRIKDAFGQAKRGVAANYLESQNERALLEKRAYQRRLVFGGPHLRALLQPAGSSQLIPTYLPDALAPGLPLFQRFRARLIAEVHMPVDQYESHPVALRALALLRVTPAPGRR